MTAKAKTKAKTKTKATTTKAKPAPKAKANEAESPNAFPRAIGKPATRALANAGYAKLDQLAKVTEAALLELHGMGPKALGILREALRARGKSFRP